MINIKKILTVGALLLLSSQVNAYWYAEAASPSGIGWGESLSLSESRWIALSNCKKYTPSWEMCYITKSYWID